MNKTNLIRLLITLSALVMFAFPLSAQEQVDSVLTFRFVSGRDMFYSPFKENKEELTRLFESVDRYKERIMSHEMMLYVDGYSVSKSSYTVNRAIAKIRSNRVKSELITRKGLKEECFVTHNHVEEGNFVLVRIFVFKKETDSGPQEKEKEIQADTVARAVEPLPVAESTERSDNAAPEPVQEISDNPEIISPQVQAEPVDIAAETSDGRFVLKTNLLGYAVLMPNAEIEWMFRDRWSAALEIQGAWYAKSTPHKVYRLATLTPELRYWTSGGRRWNGMYVGLFGGAGLYDLSNGKKGHKGEGVMAGLSAGYMWPIGKHLSIDAGIGAGYMWAHDKVYDPVPLDGHFLYQYTKNIDYIGPLRLKLSIVWRLQSVKNNR